METLAIEPAEVSFSPAAKERLAVISGEIIRLLLASVLLLSGLAKLRSPYAFLASIYGYEITGPLMSLVIATVLPWLEVMTAICLWAKIFYRGALATAILLSAMFTIVLAIALVRQLDISCGCFASADKIGYITLIRSASLLAASIIGLILTVRRSSNANHV